MMSELILTILTKEPIDILSKQNNIKDMILPLSMIILCLVGLPVTMFLARRYKKSGTMDTDRARLPDSHGLTVQEFVNVKDIRDIFLYTRDNYLISYIKVQPISIDLLSDNELRVLTRKLTDEFSQEDNMLGFLAVSRPVDISPLINEYVDIMHTTDDQIQKELLRNEIRVISEFSLSGEVVQREFFYKIWEKNSETAESDLRKRVQDLANKLDSAGLKCEILKQHNIIRLCNLVNNPAFAAIEDTNIDVTLPFLNNYENEGCI